MYNWDQKSLSKHILNTKNTIQYQHDYFLFKICPKTLGFNCTFIYKLPLPLLYSTVYFYSLLFTNFYSSQFLFGDIIDCFLLLLVLLLQCLIDLLVLYIISGIFPYLSTHLQPAHNRNLIRQFFMDFYLLGQDWQLSW